MVSIAIYLTHCKLNNDVTGQLHLHPVAETHQLRPTLTYLDAMSRKNKRRTGNGSESDSDDGPPPDPDDPAPPPVVKREKKPTGESREVQVSARKALDEKSGMQASQGGLSVVRREMILAIRTEDEETWADLEFCDGEVCLVVHCTQPLLMTFYRRQNQRLHFNLCSRRAPSH